MKHVSHLLSLLNIHSIFFLLVCTALVHALYLTEHQHALFVAATVVVSGLQGCEAKDELLWLWLSRSGGYDWPSVAGLQAEKTMETANNWPAKEEARGERIWAADIHGAQELTSSCLGIWVRPRLALEELCAGRCGNLG
jgi:hypothetical protein